MGSASLRFGGLGILCVGWAGKGLAPSSFMWGQAVTGMKKALSRVHHLAIIKRVINIFLRRMVRKQAADDCGEMPAPHRHLYGSALFWLGVCAAGQKFSLSSPPSFFFQRWELGSGLECRETVKWLFLEPLLPLSPWARCWEEAGQGRLTELGKAGGRLSLGWVRNLELNTA